MRNQTVCFTGHRQIEKSVLPILARQLEAALRQLIEEGYRYFGAGALWASTPLPPRPSCACGRSSPTSA